MIPLWCFSLVMAPFPVLATQLHPFGDGTRDIMMVPRDDDHDNVTLQGNVSFPFLGKRFDTLYISTNGFVSFDPNIPSYVPKPFPLPDWVMFSAFWLDIDPRGCDDNKIYYRQEVQNTTVDNILLSNITEQIRSDMPKYDRYTARWAYIVTFHRVRVYSGSIRCDTPRNTFQIVLTTDNSTLSFGIFYYEDLNWVYHNNDYATAGFNNGDGETYFELPGSSSPNLTLLVNSSNVNVPGRWMFRVDTFHIEDGIINHTTTTPPEATNDYSTTLLNDPTTISTTKLPVHTTKTPDTVLPPVDRLHRINSTYDGSVEWFVTAPSETLEACTELTDQDDHCIGISTTEMITNILSHIVEFNTSFLENASDIQNVSVIIDTTLDILNHILLWDAGDRVMCGADQSIVSQVLAMSFYKALEQIGNLAIAKDNETTVLSYSKDLLAVHVQKMFVSSATSGFNPSPVLINSIRATNQADTVLNASFGIANHSLGGGFTWNRTEELVADPLSLSISNEKLNEEFRKLQNQAAFSGPQLLSVQLTAVKRATFAQFSYSVGTGRRAARMAGSLLLMASFHRQLENMPDLVTVRSDVVQFLEKNLTRPYNGRKCYRCVFLNFGSPLDPNSGWSTGGCSASQRNYRNINQIEYYCSCDHATPFTMMLDLCSSLSEINDDGRRVHPLEPRVITWICLTVSIICTSLVLAHTALRLRKQLIVVTKRTFIRTNLYASIICAYVSFIFADAIIPETLDTDACFSSAIFSHWFILVTFAWVAIECYHLLRIATDVFTAQDYLSRSSNGNPWTYRLRMIFIAWVIPLFFPIICSIGTSLRFLGDVPVYMHSELWCWLNPQHVPMVLIGFVIPVTLVAILNGGTLYYFTAVKKKARKQVVERDREVVRIAQKANWERMLSSVLLCAALDVTWILGYLVLFACQDDIAKKVFAILFIVINASQGLFILIVHLRTLPEGWWTLVGDFFPRLKRLWDVPKGTVKTAVLGVTLSTETVISDGSY